MLPKESKPANPPEGKAASPGINQIGTGLSSTLLSSQRTTTHRSQTPHRGAPTRGILFAAPAALAPGTFTTLPGGFCRVKPVFRGLSYANPFAGHHYSTGSRRALRGFRQDGRRGVPRSRPFPCRPMNLPGRFRLAKSASRRIRGTARSRIRWVQPSDPGGHSRAPAFRSFACFVRSALAERKLRAQRIDRQIRWARPASHCRRTAICPAQRRRTSACRGAAPGSGRAAGPPPTRSRPPR